MGGTQPGMIILGNCGVGKSFLVKIISDIGMFYQYRTPLFGIRRTAKHDYTIFDTPGLIETNQTNIDKNAREIDRVLAKQEDSIVIHVFRLEHGHLREDDILAFNAFEMAYQVNMSSLLLIINYFPANQSQYYEKEVILSLNSYIRMPISLSNLCFLNYINPENLNERKTLQDQLLSAIDTRVPSKIVKIHDIRLNIDEIDKHRKRIAKEIKRYEHDITNNDYSMQKQGESYHIFPENQQVNDDSVSQSIKQEIMKIDKMLENEQADYSDLLKMEKAIELMPMKNKLLTEKISQQNTQQAQLIREDLKVLMSKQVLLKEKLSKCLGHPTQNIPAQEQKADYSELLKMEKEIELMLMRNKLLTETISQQNTQQAQLIREELKVLMSKHVLLKEKLSKCLGHPTQNIPAQEQKADYSELLKMEKEIELMLMRNKLLTEKIAQQNTQQTQPIREELKVLMSKQVLLKEKISKCLGHPTQNIPAPEQEATHNEPLVDELTTMNIADMERREEVDNDCDVQTPSNNTIESLVIPEEPAASSNRTTVDLSYKLHNRIRYHDENIMIVSLNINFNSMNPFAKYDFKHFQEEFSFIAHILSTKNKILFLIISSLMSGYVIPLIHKHFCIENIYLFDSAPVNCSNTASLLSEKIIGSWSNVDELYFQVINDISRMTNKLLQWNHSTKLFAMLHTQQFETTQSLTIKIPTHNARNERVVIFHCDEKIIYGSNKELDFVHEFIDIEQCCQFIINATQAQIFLIISGNKVPDALQETYDLQQIRTIYFFHTDQIEYPANRYKMRGPFRFIENLSRQVEEDILFFREQHFHTARIDIFSTIEVEDDEKLVLRLNKQQIDFLLFNLFIDILPEIPLLQITQEDIENKYNNLSLRTRDNQAKRFKITISNTGRTQVNQFESNPELSQIILRIHQLNNLNDLFIIQKQLTDIQERVLNSSKASAFFTVYLTKILSDNDFEMMQRSHNEFISIGIFLLATKSLLQARNIARQVADNGLLSVLFEIEVTHDTHLLKVDEHRVMFRLDAVFRLESINKGPDDVQYVKLKCVDSQFQLIKERIKLEMEMPLSWLTFGNYLYSFNCFEQAEAYYKHLLAKLPSDHPSLFSIYNNLGIIYNMNNNEDKAYGYYMLALRCARPISAVSTFDLDQNQEVTVNPTTKKSFSKIHITSSTVFGSIADVHYENNNPEKALEFYTKAFESATDPQCLLYYQQMIITLSKMLRKT